MNIEQKYVVKAGVSFSLISFAVGILLVRILDKLYPILYMSVFVSISCIVLIGICYQNSLQYISYLLAVIIIISIVFRTYVYQFPPSFYNLDVDYFAAQSFLVIQSGHIGSITNFYYEKVPLFIIGNVITSLILGKGVSKSLIIYPIITGLLVPLTSAVLARRTFSTHLSTIIATSLATVSTFSVLYSWIPIPNTLGMIYLLVFSIILILYYMDSLRKKRLELQMLLIILVAALMFVHKLPIAVAFAVTSILSIYIITSNIFLSIDDHHWPQSILPIIIALALIVQWTLLTEFFSIRLFGLISGVSPTVSHLPSPAAVKVGNGLFSTIFRGMNIFILFPVSGIAWVFFAFYSNNRFKIHIILIFAAATVIFTVVSLIVWISANPGRGIFTAEPFAILLVSGLIGRRLSNTNGALNRILIAGVIIIIIGSQLFAGIGAPNREGQPRRSLTQGEIQAKKFEFRLSPGIAYMDSDYSGRMISPSKPQTRYYHHDLDPALLQGSIPKQQYPVVLYRTDVKIWSLSSGWYRLTWNPENHLRRKYNTIYSNGDTCLFKSK